jgi:hypothetical protein
VSSQQLERRLNGLHFLQSIVEMVSNSKRWPTGVQVYGIESDDAPAYYQRVETSQYLTPSMLIAGVPVSSSAASPFVSLVNWVLLVLSGRRFCKLRL